MGFLAVQFTYILGLMCGSCLGFRVVFMYQREGKYQFLRKGPGERLWP